MTERRDAELVRRHLGGEEVAFEELYRRHAPAVWRFAVHCSGSRNGADEVLQETFIRAAARLRSFRGRSELRTWLFAVARNAAADLGRKRRRDVRETAVETIDVPNQATGAAAEAADPADRAETRELIGELRRAVASLPEAERACLVLCERQGSAVREAAGALGWSETKTKVTLFRARRRLRKMLAKHVE